MKMIDRDGRKIRGYAIISKGDMPQKLQRGTYRIPSQSGHGDYIVKSHNPNTHFGNMWECSCPDWTKNRVDCKHIYAIQFWLELKDKLDTAKPITMDTEHIEIVSCPDCKRENLIKRGIRYNQNVTKQRYSCKNCKKRFVLDVAKKTKGDGRMVTMCLDLYFKGISLRKIQDHLKQFYGAEISHMTIHRWLHKFMTIANQHAEDMTPHNIGGMWHTDEQMIKNNGGYLWVWNCMDAKTRYLLANNVTQTRFAEDAQQVFDKAKKYGQPDIIVTDGLKGYRKGIRNAFKGCTWKTPVIHVKADGLTSRKKNNNKIERYHNTFRERDKILRGFKNKKSAEFMSQSYKTYYNHVKPHMALGGMTPSQVAGIPLTNNRNRWKVLLTQG